MTQMNKTHIVVILDRSGSMSAIRNDAIGGFNTFLAQQQALPGEATLTRVQFDDQYQVDCSFLPLRSVSPLNAESYVPRGSTALYDAIGRTVNGEGAALARMPEGARPQKVLVLIITDGFENASREFRGSRIAEMIKHQREKYAWEFIFIGSDESAIKDAQNTLGVLANATRSYSSSREAVTKGLISASAGAFSYRSSNQRGGGQSLGGYDDSADAVGALEQALKSSESTKTGG